MIHQAFGANFDDKWCILRTSPGRTLLLANALSSAGFGSWTPRRMEERRRPRSTIRFDREVAIAPGFVFVPAEHLEDLWRALVLPINPFPVFSIFGLERRVAIISGCSLNGLREVEAEADAWWKGRLARRERAQKRSKRYLYPRGTLVRLPDHGSFTGLVGVVEDGDDRTAMIDFGGGRLWKIDTWRLVPDDIEKLLSSKDKATQMALAS